MRLESGSDRLCDSHSPTAWRLSEAPDSSASRKPHVISSLRGVTAGAMLRTAKLFRLNHLMARGFFNHLRATTDAYKSFYCSNLDLAERVGFEPAMTL
jgi:hypothetical protein